jgi:hypothetical protein
MVVELMLRELYRVAEVRTADGAALAPPEISERFQGRLFTLADLESRAVRITSRDGWYTALGQDWHLILEPAT